MRTCKDCGGRFITIQQDERRDRKVDVNSSGPR
jgi:hypothetical protein